MQGINQHMKKGHGEKRTRKQTQFIAALLSHPTLESAAAAVGINPTTAWRWMKLDDFEAEYRKARGACIEQTTARLRGAATIAVTALVEVATYGDTDAARVSAARAILDNAYRAAELEDIAERLEQLEKNKEH